MEYASLSWMSAPPTHLGLLDNIQRKALKIIGVDQDTARETLSIDSLCHRRQVAAATVLYKMHTPHCPKDLQEMLPPPKVRRRTTRLCTATPGHALEPPGSNTRTQDRTFLHTAVRVWNSLPVHVVNSITDNGLQAFKRRVHRHLLTITSHWLLSCSEPYDYPMDSVNIILLGYCSQLHLIKNYN